MSIRAGRSRRRSGRRGSASRPATTRSGRWSIRSPDPRDKDKGYLHGRARGLERIRRRMAKAGYMTPEEAQTLTEIEQCRMWIGRYSERELETKMRSKSLTSLRQQHLFGVDLQSVKRDVRWNADYDMKRKPVKVRDVDGLITADTVPWRTIDEFKQARDLLEDWKRSRR